METRFKKFKAAFLQELNGMDYCRDIFTEVFEAKEFSQLMNVIISFMDSAVEEKLITSTIINCYQEFKEEFNAHFIYYNEDCCKGYLLADQGKIKVWGDAHVYACGDAELEAWDWVVIHATDRVKIDASDCVYIDAQDEVEIDADGRVSINLLYGASATACGNVHITAHISHVAVQGNATVIAFKNSEIEASGNARVIVMDELTTVKAAEGAYIISEDVIDCELADQAIHRITNTNTIRTACELAVLEIVKPNK